MLTHYTKRIEAVTNILVHGFGWMRCSRKLCPVLIPSHDFSQREPQDFGMISFTEVEPQHAQAHCSVFGCFGIVISDGWARKHRAQRVVYVDEKGPFTDALKELFNIGYKDVKARIEYPDDKGWLLAYENKNAAGAIAGSRMWYDLLTLWEYLEPAESASQREWRVVNPQPLYSLRTDKAESIAQISPPQGWAKWDNVVPICRGDIEAFVCRTSDVDLLRKRIPDVFGGVEIVQTTF